MRNNQSKGSRIISTMKTLLLNIFTLVIAILIFIFNPILYLPLIPFAIWRYFLAKTIPKLYPEVSKMVCSRSQVLAVDDIYHKPKCNIVGAFVFEGNIEVEEAVSQFENNVLNAKQPNGEPQYPELKQYLTTRLGYYFFKKDKGFDIQNHVTIMEKPKDKDIFTDDDVLNILENSLCKKWQPKRPLYEFIIVRNYFPKHHLVEGPHSCAILNIHHSYADGYSLLILFIERMCGKPIVNAIPNYFHRRWYQMILHYSVFYFQWCWEIATLYANGVTYLPWRAPNQKDNDFRITMTDWIPISKIKDIKTHFGVSFTSVVLATITGGMRDMMIKKGTKMVDKLPCGIPLPIPGHSNKLRNYMTVAMAQLPLGEEDPVQRLKACFKDYERIKRSVLPEACVFLMKCAGVDPPWLTKIVSNNTFVPTGLTNFPAGYEWHYFKEHRLIDVIGTTGAQHGNVGSLFASLSYMEGFRISPTISSAILTKEESQELSRMIEKHINILHEFVNQDV